MGHLPDHNLCVWRTGEQLTAEALNGNFAILRADAERALSQALTPDPVVVALEMRLGRLEARLDRVEGMLEMHARQRNEREWAPLSTLGGVLQRVDGLQQSVEAAVARLEEMFGTINDIHDDQQGRLARLEQQPEAATLAQFSKLEILHEDTAKKARSSLAKATALQRETADVRRIAEGHDRIANCREYAPLAALGQLLERLEKLEQRK